MLSGLLGVPPRAYVDALAKALKPGGLMLIYNIGPGPRPDGRGVDDDGKVTYINMADVRCPFPRAMWTEAGFEILAYDADDSMMIRRYGHAFGWDDPETMQGSPMDLVHDLFVRYTLVRMK